jgi:tRNA threonylcarbamoyladenosine biosynthesis protein TsaE
MAETLGAKLCGGEVIELASDLGGGKTTFTKGIVRGAGSNEHVSSPSFTISNEYRAGELTIHHMDFYRLPDAGIMKQELLDILSDPKSVVIVEWAGIVADVLPEHRLRITITATGENSRSYEFAASDELSYLLPSDT